MGFRGAERGRVDEELRALGWQNLGDTRGLRMEGVGSFDNYVGRLWSPTGTYRGVSSPGGMYVLLGVEGGADVSYGGETLDLQPDHLVFLDSEAEIDVQLTAATARYLWKLRPTALANPLVRERMGEPIPVARDAWQVVAALTNSALKAPPGVAQSPYLLRASELLLAALFEESDGVARVKTSTRPDQVFGEAIAVIEATFRTVDTRPATVASDVCVSERTLRRAFTLMGTTPRREIEFRRTRELRALLETHGTTTAFATLCEMSGFASARLGREALRRVD